MKRCPECRRDYTDETLNYCLDDGAALVDGPSASLLPDEVWPKVGAVGVDEPATALITPHETEPITRTFGSGSSLGEPAKNYRRAASRRGTITAVLTAFGLLAMVGIGSYVYLFRGSGKQIDSIAVLPFVNESGNADVDYLSDGMTETLINTLTQLPDLTVKARSSVFRYKGKEILPETVGKELNVQAVVSGRVTQRGDDLTLYVSLVDTRTGNQLWGEQYNRKQADLLALQNTVARDVATKLRNKLSGADEQKVARNYTQNTDAYQLYLQGRFFANKRTPQSIEKAIEYFQQAIDKDKNYALGYAGLSDAYGLLAYYEGGASAPSLLDKARAAALQALALDGDLAESHNALGLVLTTGDFDYSAGEREYTKAIELNPSYTTAHQNLGVVLCRTGHTEEGLAELRRALELEPFSIIVNRLYGEVLVFSRRYDEGMAQLTKTLEMDPSFPTTYFALSQAYRLTSKYSESVEAFARFNELYGRPQTAAFARSSFAAGGWQAFLRDMTGKRPDGFGPYMAAVFFAELSDKDKAFAELDKAVDERDYMTRFLKIDPSVDSLRDDPRFASLLRKTNLAG